MSEAVRARVKINDTTFIDVDIIENIVLHYLDLMFLGTTFETLISRKW